MASEDAEGETRHLLAGSASEAGSRSSTQLYDMEHGTSSTGATGYEYGDSDDEDEFEEEESQEAQGRLDDDVTEPGDVDTAAIRDGIQTACLMVIAVVAAGMGMIYLSFVLVPLVLAVFFVYLFQPMINFMVGKKKIFFFRLRLPRPLAVLIVIFVVICILFALAAAIYFSVQEIINDSDKYIERFDEIYDNILEWAEDQGFDKDEVLSWLPDISVGEITIIVLGQLVDLVPQSILCLLFTIYMLLDYKETKPKSRLQRRIDRQIRKYIVIKVAISLLTGALVGGVLAALQVDLFFLFALLTFLLNFIPSVGSMIAVALPMPVVILDPDQEWWSMLLALAIPSVIQLTVGNLVEPAVMGKSMSISAVAVLAALSFFGTVWGIVGAFLSVPLAVILHMWLKSIDSPFAQFFGDLIGGHFSLFEEQGDEKREKAL